MTLIPQIENITPPNDDKSFQETIVYLRTELEKIKLEKTEAVMARNQARAAIITALRKGVKASRITAPVALWIISLVKVIPVIQIMALSGRGMDSRRASSNLLRVLSAFLDKVLKIFFWHKSTSNATNMTRKACNTYTFS